MLTALILFSSYLCFATEDRNEMDSLYKKLINLRNSNIDTVIYYSDLLNTLAKRNESKEYEYKSLIIKVKALIKSGQHIDALNICKQTKRFIEEQKLSEHRLEVEMYLGHTFLAAGFASEAMKIFLVIQNHKSELDIQNQVDIDYYTGIAYIETGDIEKGTKYIEQSIKTDIERNNSCSSFASFILLANLSENIDSIRMYYGLADTVVGLNPDWSYQKAVLLNNLALFNEAIDNLAVSKSQYLAAIKLAQESGLNEILSNLYNNYAYTLTDEQKYDSAELILGKALVIAKQLNSSELLGTIYDSYKDYEFAVGNYELAINYMDSSVYFKNMFKKQKKIKESVFISAMFETEQMENKILEKDNRINRLLITVLTGITVLTFLIGFLVFSRQRLKLARSKLEAVRKDRRLEIADALIKGQDNERKRVAMDLHDGLSAQLSTLNLIIDGFISSHEKYPEISSSVKKIHETVRELSHRMLPTQLENFGLISAINNIASSVKKAGKFTVKIETNLNERLSEKLEVNLYYLIFELVNNAIKHSKGNKIFVQLIKHDNLLSLSVEDNGKGFGLKSKTGLGLNNIKTRVDYLGGTFMMDIEGTETIFMLEIPIKEK